MNLHVRARQGAAVQAVVWPVASCLTVAIEAPEPMAWSAAIALGVAVSYVCLVWLLERSCMREAMASPRTSHTIRREGSPVGRIDNAAYASAKLFALRHAESGWREPAELGAAILEVFGRVLRTTPVVMFWFAAVGLSMTPELLTAVLVIAHHAEATSVDFISRGLSRLAWMSLAGAVVLEVLQAVLGQASRLRDRYESSIIGALQTHCGVKEGRGRWSVEVRTSNSRRMSRARGAISQHSREGGDDR